jgi:phospholipid/cholesterol/gamma-HCH transport system substrate-binding protein
MTARVQRCTALLGAFVVGVLVLAAAAVRLLGGGAGLFTRTVTLHLYVNDSSGLGVDAPVRLAGIPIGRVSSIDLPEDLNIREARISLAVRERYLPRLRADSEAVISGRGLLGNEGVDISPGSPDKPMLHHGETIPARPARVDTSLAHVLTKLDSAVAAMTQANEAVATALHNAVTPEASADLRRMLHATADLLEAIEHGDGLAHRALYDPAYARNAGKILNETQLSLLAAHDALLRFSALAAAIQRGGTLHELLYGEHGARAFAELHTATAELARLLGNVRTQPGLLHSLVYDESTADILSQWTDFSERVNRLSRQLEQGQGTVGGLLVDPSIYEDVKGLLGDLERNVAFKALIRYTINAEALKRPAPAMKPAVVEPAASPK